MHFVSATERPWLELFCRANDIPQVDRIDVWADLAEPYLDTAFDTHAAERTAKRLAACGLDAAQVSALRGRIREPMLAYTALTWEWAHYGHADVLVAMKATLSPADYRAFEAESMAIAGQGAPVEPFERSLTERLRSRWLGLMSRLGVRDNTEPLLGQLTDAYQGPGRHYHDLSHVAAVLERVEALAAAHPERDAASLAAWFHDVVYDPLRQDNEAASAALVRETLTPLGVSPATIARAAALVERTATPTQAADPLERAFMDADFSIVAETPDVYDRYAAAVRREYGVFSDPQFQAGRAQFLRGLLRRIERDGQLFYDLPPLCEALAVENIRRELARLVG